jgi:hypothetical protein
MTVFKLNYFIVLLITSTFVSRNTDYEFYEDFVNLSEKYFDFSCHQHLKFKIRLVSFVRGLFFASRIGLSTINGIYQAAYAFILT